MLGINFKCKCEKREAAESFSTLKSVKLIVKLFKMLNEGNKKGNYSKPTPMTKKKFVDR